MRNILCYGDSLTWGFNPDDWSRFEYEDRWTSSLQKELGKGFYVTVDALSGRTTNWDVPYLANRNGVKTLPVALEVNSPLDLVIVMLGSNDMIKMLDKTAEDSSMGMMSLIVNIMENSLSGRNGVPPKILIVAPPVFAKTSEFMSISYSGRTDEMKKIPGLYRILAKAYGCHFLDSNEFIKVSEPDGIHISKESQKILGVRVAEEVKKIHSR